METLGDVGDGATPVGVVAGLGGDYITKNAKAACHGGTGVVEASFDRENGWFLHIVSIITGYYLGLWYFTGENLVSRKN